VAVCAAVTVTVVATCVTAAVDGSAQMVWSVEEVARLQRRCTGAGSGADDAEKERQGLSCGDGAALRAGAAWRG
jgi:hypothetical protein